MLQIDQRQNVYVYIFYLYKTKLPKWSVYYRYTFSKYISDVNTTAILNVSEIEV